MAQVIGDSETTSHFVAAELRIDLGSISGIRCLATWLEPVDRGRGDVYWPASTEDAWRSLVLRLATEIIQTYRDDNDGFDGPAWVVFDPERDNVEEVEIA